MLFVSSVLVFKLQCGVFALHVDKFYCGVVLFSLFVCFGILFLHRMSPDCIVVLLFWKCPLQWALAYHWGSLLYFIINKAPIPNENYNYVVFLYFQIVISFKNNDSFPESKGLEKIPLEINSVTLHMTQKMPNRSQISQKS